MFKLLLFIPLFVISYFGVSYLYFANGTAEAPSILETTKDILAPKNSDNSDNPANSGDYQNSDSSYIQVDAIEAGSTVKMPLTITGKAKGSWYFEGSFPVYVRDSKGVDVGYGIAQAQGSWMTEALVPFVVDIELERAIKTGFIVFHNDNPSGEEGRDRSYTIPVSFTY